MRSFLALLFAGLVLLSAGLAWAQQTLAEAVKLLDAGKLRDAEEKLRRVIQLVPHAPNPYLLLGIVLFRLGLCAEAVKQFDEFLSRVSPTDRRITEVISMRDRCREELAPKFGRLRGADVRLDDDRGAPIGRTPVDATAFPAGAHLVFVELPGFRVASRAINLGNNETIQLSPAWRRGRRND
jgi:tetratricopeptide (TPR) repeat protein